VGGSIGTLTNNGTIIGGAGGPGEGSSGNGGAGLFNRGALTAKNAGKIQGGGGFYGGYGVLNWGINDSVAESPPVSLSNSGSVIGGAGGVRDGGAGVGNVFGGNVQTLTNAAGGQIQGGAGGPSGAGGAGVYNDLDSYINTFKNSGTVAGGAGLYSGPGGAGVANFGTTAHVGQSGTITALTNNATGTIAGGAGGSSGAGGAGVANNGGAITTLTNRGMIKGGAGGTSAVGGAGVANNHGTITTLTNSASGTLAGGAGGRGFTGSVGGAGLQNSGSITNLTNQGTIRGGQGGLGGMGGMGPSGAAGVSNSGQIGTLSNSGTISGFDGVSNTGSISALDNAASGVISGANIGLYNTGSIGHIDNAGLIDPTAVEAILSTGSIGSIDNTGRIVGSVVIDQSDLTVNGGTGGRFGSWTGGTITVVGGNLTFARGNTSLGDNVVVNGGRGTVYDGVDDPLQIANPVTITGNFSQRGELDFLLSGSTNPMQYQLTVTGGASLDGGLGIDLASGFHLMAGDSFDLLTTYPVGALYGGFDSLSLDGAACSAHASDVWSCGGFYLGIDVVTGASGFVDLSVAGSAIPEPSTWAMLGLGFLGLAGLSLRRRPTILAA
jgi:PEP-CTERM motif